MNVQLVLVDEGEQLFEDCKQKLKKPRQHSMFRTNWRDLEEWEAEKVPIKSTTSNEAAKLFDVALTQYVGWFDDPAHDGLEATIDKMLKADPNFVHGRTLAFGLDLLSSGRTIRTDASFAKDLNELKQLATTRIDLAPREARHIEALDHFAHGNMRRAGIVWEEILIDHPTDMLAVKFAHDTYFYLGAKHSIRDSIARIYPYWHPDDSLATSKAVSIPLAEYIHGMYAFGLEETQFYAEGERQAKLGLERNRHDAWATHALAHVYEMGGRSREGLRFISTTVGDWSRSNYLACHNYWHWGLFHINEDEPEAAAEIFDTEICRRAEKSGAMLDIVDACSLLYRLDLLEPLGVEGVDFDFSKKWPNVGALVQSHVGEAILGFNEAHFAMACLGQGHLDKAQELVNDLRVTEVPHDGWLDVTIAVIEAMIAFKQELYRETIDKLWPLRYEIVKMGGSDAQRDVFQLLLMAAASRIDRNLWQRLVNERKALKGQDDYVTRRASCPGAI